MSAYQLNIEAKERQHIGLLASLADFTYTEGDPVNPNLVIENPQVSLYCLDDSRKQAIFVELPTGTDLTKAPFVYQTQYEQAQRLITVPYETFITLGNDLPAIQRPIFVHITGRSGSTLLSHVFNESGVVASLAEPDVATQFVNLHHNTNGKCEAELHNLVDITLRFLFKSHHSPDVQAHAIKFRNQAVQVMDLFQTAFPQAKNIFLYRDVIGYVTSFYRIVRKTGASEILSVRDWQNMFETFLAADFSHLLDYLDEGADHISLVEQLTVWWIAVMEWYLEQVDRGTPVQAVRFADLTQSPQETISQIFAYCDLPINNVQAGLTAYERDAQAGTMLARENPKEGNKRTLSDDQRQSILTILQRHPVLNSSDFIAPKTLQI